MSARLKMNRDWTETIRVGNPQKLDKNDMTHNIIKSRLHKCIKEGNYEEIGNLQVVSNAFSSVDNGVKELIDIVTMYKFQDANGVKVEVPSGDHESFLKDPAWTLTETYQHNVEV